MPMIDVYAPSDLLPTGSDRRIGEELTNAVLRAEGVSAGVAASQVAAFREWEQSNGTSFANLKDIHQPTLVVNGIHDEMIPIANSYRLVENLPNAMLVAYPDAGHGALFQYHESFTRQASAFLASDSPFTSY